MFVTRIQLLKEKDYKYFGTLRCSQKSPVKLATELWEALISFRVYVYSPLCGEASAPKALNPWPYLKEVIRKINSFLMSKSSEKWHPGEGKSG